MMVRDRPAIQIVDGFRLPGFYSEEVYWSGLRYQPEESDIILVTFPKCGTHWVLEIVQACFRVCRGVTPGWSSLEKHGMDGILKADRPRIICTHLPFHLASFSPSTKYIYVARNPKDCCVSFYHHTKELTDYCFQDGTFEEYFEIFIEGLTDNGSYYENLLSWYAKKDEPNVLFLTYESIHADMKESVLKIAGFIDDELAKKLAEDEEKLKAVFETTTWRRWSLVVKLLLWLQFICRTTDYPGCRPGRASKVAACLYSSSDSLHRRGCAREDVQRALQTEVPINMTTPGERTVSYDAVARRPPQAPHPAKPGASSTFHSNAAVSPIPRRTRRRIPAYGERPTDARYHCGEADHIYPGCPCRRLGLRRFRANDPRPKHEERPRDIEEFLRLSPSSEPSLCHESR
ncbi:hypothetical protein HPB47_017088 [Ixodes persulcatus]|uniref:Uncharacterized protein n=1 Tax=Ixodes persulcatus TaxID=34615 RepID=A0AC60QP78_IXOPE|nr:hypothetical protein HPB47_017088 [Ixodes persulcatus]